MGEQDWSQAAGPQDPVGQEAGRGGQTPPPTTHHPAAPLPWALLRLTLVSLPQWKAL